MRKNAILRVARKITINNEKPVYCLFIIMNGHTVYITITSKWRNYITPHVHTIPPLIMVPFCHVNTVNLAST